jgi:hypothetical protein
MKSLLTKQPRNTLTDEQMEELLSPGNEPLVFKDDKDELIKALEEEKVKKFGIYALDETPDSAWNRALDRAIDIIKKMI